MIHGPLQPFLRSPRTDDAIGRIFNGRVAVTKRSSIKNGRPNCQQAGANAVHVLMLSRMRSAVDMNQPLGFARVSQVHGWIAATSRWSRVTHRIIGECRRSD